MTKGNWKDHAASLSPTKTTRSPGALVFTSSGHAYALQDNGGIFISSDGGLTWGQGTAGTKPLKTYGLAAHAPKSGPVRVLVSGQTSHVSVNGGTQWTDLSGFPQLGGRLDSAAFDDQGTAYLAERYNKTTQAYIFTSTW